MLDFSLFSLRGVRIDLMGVLPVPFYFSGEESLPIMLFCLSYLVLVYFLLDTYSGFCSADFCFSRV